MLLKINRITKKQDFNKTFKEGKGFSGDFLFLKILKNNTKVSRFGFVISRKVSKKSTIRNKIKRRLSEIIKLKLPEIKKGLDIIFVAKQNLENQDFKKTGEILEKILKMARLIQK